MVMNCSEQERTGIAFCGFVRLFGSLIWDNSVQFLEFALLCFIVKGEHATAAPAASDKQYVPECQRDTNGTERAAAGSQERKLYTKQKRFFIR